MSSSIAEPGSPPRRTRLPRSLNLVRDPAPEEVGAAIDWRAWYLTDEEDMGQSTEQDEIVERLKSILQQLARERGWRDVYIGVDAFFAWVEDHPLVRVSPDVYTVRAPPDPPPPSFQTWRPGHPPPTLAVEIVSEDWKKDYEEGPAKYAQLGAAELVVFDPAALRGRGGSRRVPLQVYRREADGAFVLAYRGSGPCRADTIDAWVLATWEGQRARLRVARDATAEDLVPTAEEARRAERALRERAEHERERAEHERERAEQRGAAAASQSARVAEENERLRAELEALKKSLGGRD